MIRFMRTAFPEFHVCGEGLSQDRTHWVHIGTAETYIALGQSRRKPASEILRGMIGSSCSIYRRIQRSGMTIVAGSVKQVSKFQVSSFKEKQALDYARET